MVHHPTARNFFRTQQLIEDSTSNYDKENRWSATPSSRAEPDKCSSTEVAGAKLSRR